MKYLLITLLFITAKVNSAELQTPIKKGSTKFEKNSTVKFEGKILDKNNVPIAGATIIIHDIKIIVLSDDEGNFSTPKFSNGKYLVEVNHIGYASKIETIDLQTNTIKNFVLQESITEHDAITVTGVASAVKVKHSAQPVSILRKNDLQQTTATNIIDALSNKVAGVASLSTGPAISKPVIRGLGYNRVLVINDGVRQEGQQWGDEHGIEIDENSVQKAEIIKGPASLMYGSDAMAGVINLLTNVPIEAQTIKANLGYQFLDNNGLHNANANVAGHLKNGFNFNAFTTYKSAKDYQNKFDGRVFNSRYNEQNFGGYIGLNKSWGFTHLLISNFNQKTGLIEGERDASTGKFLVFGGSPNERLATTDELNSRDLFTPYQHIKHFKITSDNNVRLGTGRLSINVAFQRNQRLEFGDYDEPTKPELYFDLKTITYNLQYHLPNYNNWKTTIGINGMQQQNENKADEVIIPDYRQFDAGLFVYSKKTINKLSLSGGLRLDYRKLNTEAFFEDIEQKFENLNQAFSNFSGSIGLAYEMNKNQILKLNVARGYRAPTVSEISSNGIHEGTNRYEYGDRNLKTETSFQIDAGLDFNTEHFSLNFNAFYNNIQNYIYYAKLQAANGGDSIVATPDLDAFAFKFGQANATLYGFEAKLDIHPHPLDWLHFENSFSLVQGRFNQNFEGTNRLPFMPAPRWQSELRGDFKKIGKKIKNAYLKFEMDNVSKQNNIFFAYNTETITKGYTLLNIGAGGEIVNKNKIICKLFFGLNNITNVAYQNHLSRLKYTSENMLTGRTGVFNMGRNFSARIVIPLVFSAK